MDLPESNAVFRLLKHGLVVIEHDRDSDHFMIVRPASLAGSQFRGCTEDYNVGMAGTSLTTNVPAAMLTPTNFGWLVDISSVAAPGPGPVWFNAEFAKCEDAVDAIVDCYFSDGVDNFNDSLVAFYGVEADS